MALGKFSKFSFCTRFLGSQGVRVVSEEKRDGEVLKKFRFGDGQGSGDQGLESVCTNLEMQLADASTNQSGDLEDLMEGNDAIGCQ